MKKKTIIREVYLGRWPDAEGISITDPDGELDKFYPCRVHPAEQPGCCDTLEISVEFFRYIAMLQSRGVKIIFRS